jgi:mycothiol synthase
VDAWGRERAAELTALVAAALPDEDLRHDELLGCCWDDPESATASGLPVAGPRAADSGAVLGAGDGTGAASVVVRAADPATGEGPIGYLKLIAVHPDARRAGRGHRLLAAVEDWAWDQGASELRLAGSPPFYLWPGVDALATEMLCLAESRGYTVMGSDINMALPTTFRRSPPAGVSVRRVLSDDDKAKVDALVAPRWPEWMAEMSRAVDNGCCHVAVADVDEVADVDGAAVGFVCHSVNRAGWLGPMGTDPAHRGGGVGGALLGEVCRDLMIAEFAYTEISWVGPIRFYAKLGATVSRSFFRYRLSRP